MVADLVGAAVSVGGGVMVKVRVQDPVGSLDLVERQACLAREQWVLATVNPVPEVLKVVMPLFVLPL